MDAHVIVDRQSEMNAHAHDMPARQTLLLKHLAAARKPRLLLVHPPEEKMDKKVDAHIIIIWGSLEGRI
jgi:hypothetical protein